MLRLDDLSRQVEAFQFGQIDIDQFEDWFRTNSRGAYKCAGEELSDVVAAVEAVFSRYHFEGIDESEIPQELGDAIRPFVSGPVYAAPREIVYGKPPQQARSAIHSFLRVSAAVVA